MISIRMSTLLTSFSRCFASQYPITLKTPHDKVQAKESCSETKDEPLVSWFLRRSELEKAETFLLWNNPLWQHLVGGWWDGTKMLTRPMRSKARPAGLLDPGRGLPSWVLVRSELPRSRINHSTVPARTFTKNQKSGHNYPKEGHSPMGSKDRLYGLTASLTLPRFQAFIWSQGWTAS